MKMTGSRYFMKTLESQQRLSLEKRFVLKLTKSPASHATTVNTPERERSLAGKKQEALSIFIFAFMSSYRLLL